jgi:hypothetical protein
MECAKQAITIVFKRASDSAKPVTTIKTNNLQKTTAPPAILHHTPNLSFRLPGEPAPELAEGNPHPGPLPERIRFP